MKNKKKIEIIPEILNVEIQTNLYVDKSVWSRIIIILLQKLGILCCYID